jgi:hypothetical protein
MTVPKYQSDIHLSLLADQITSGAFDDQIASFNHLRRVLQKQEAKVNATKRAETYATVYTINVPDYAREGKAALLHGMDCVVDRRNRKTWTITVVNTGATWRLPPSWISEKVVAA